MWLVEELSCSRTCRVIQGGSQPVPFVASTAGRPGTCLSSSQQGYDGWGLRQAWVVPVSKLLFPQFSETCILCLLMYMWPSKSAASWLIWDQNTLSTRLRREIWQTQTPWWRVDFSLVIMLGSKLIAFWSALYWTVFRLEVRDHTISNDMLRIQVVICLSVNTQSHNEVF